MSKCYSVPTPLAKRSAPAGARAASWRSSSHPAAAGSQQFHKPLNQSISQRDENSPKISHR